jgi:hypothetical protein
VCVFVFLCSISNEQSNSATTTQNVSNLNATWQDLLQDQDALAAWNAFINQTQGGGNGNSTSQDAGADAPTLQDNTATPVAAFCAVCGGSSSQSNRSAGTQTAGNANGTRQGSRRRSSARRNGSWSRGRRGSSRRYRSSRSWPRQAWGVRI